jgi:hypothetical protein
MTPHEQEQAEARAAELGCTVLPPEVRPDHPAFAALIAAVLGQKQPLTQAQIRGIIDNNNTSET